MCHREGKRFWRGLGYMILQHATRLEMREHCRAHAQLLGPQTMMTTFIPVFLLLLLRAYRWSEAAAGLCWLRMRVLDCLAFWWSCWTRLVSCFSFSLHTHRQSWWLCVVCQQHNKKLRTQCGKAEGGENEPCPHTRPTLKERRIQKRVRRKVWRAFFLFLTWLCVQ